MLLLTIFVVSITLAYLSGKELLLGTDLLDEELPSSSTFAIMVANDDGEYEEYTESETWPADMYFNSNLSYCVDKDGVTVEESLTYDNGYATLTSSDTSYCWLYFDPSDPCNDQSITVTSLKDAYDRYCTLDNAIENDGLDGIDSLWDSTLTADGYRYYSDISTTTSSSSNDYDVTGCCYSNGYVTTSGSCSTLYVWVYVNNTTGSTSSSITSSSCMYLVDRTCSSDGDGTYSCLAGCSTITGSSCTIASGTYTTTTTDYDVTDPDNYVCFGTTSSSTCLSNTSKYLYRIIGIFADSSGNYHLKLVKAEALDTSYAFSSSNTSSWSSSSLYTGLNTTTTSLSYYLYNTTYMSSTWRAYIEKWNWKLLSSGCSTGVNVQVTVDTSTGSSSSTQTTQTSGTCFSDITTEDLYDAENSTTNTVSAYVGLMYPSDYKLSLGASSLDDPSSTYLNKSWISLSSNDASAPSSSEWLMAVDGSYGYSVYVNGTLDSSSSGNIIYSYIDASGTLTGDEYSETYSVRPVFYLTSDVIITEGDGSSTSPYILSTN